MNVTMNENKVLPVVRDGELTHGTLEAHKLPESRSFYEEVLQLRCVQHGPVSQMVAGSAEFAMACVNAGNRLSPQGDENRWVLSVANAETVNAIREAALASNFTQHVGDLSEKDGISSFIVQDADSNWWEVTNLPATYYQSFFEKGDVA